MMKSEKMKYISENLGKKTVKEMSKELGMKEKKLRKLIEDAKRARDTVSAAPDEKTPVPAWLVGIALALIAALGFAVYSLAYNGGFIWDDVALVRDNLYIRDIKYLADIFNGTVTSAADSYKFYRPMQIFTYVIDHYLWGQDIRGYHFTNILLHVLVACAVYLLVNIVSRNNRAAFLMSALFIVHPVHTEAVYYISGRSDILGAFFLLISMIFYIKASEGGKVWGYVLMTAAYIGALLSREASLAMVLLLPLYCWVFNKKIDRKAILCVISVTVVYLAVMYQKLGVNAAKEIAEATFSQRVPGFFAAIFNYLRILFFPVDLHMEYGNDSFNPMSFKPIAGFFMAMVFFVAGYKIRRKEKLISFGIFWFFIALLPVSNLYPLKVYMAEHWLYVPSLGLFLVMGEAFGRFSKLKLYKYLSAGLFFITVMALSYLTVKQHSYWKDPITFFERTLEFAPRSSLIYSSLGDEYLAKGEHEKAIEVYERAIAIYPDRVAAYNNLGNAYGAIGDEKKAVEVYKKALTIERDSPVVHANLAASYYNLGEYELAGQHAKRAKELGESIHPELDKMIGLSGK